MELDYELLKNIIRIGGQCHPGLVDPSANEELSRKGVAMLTANIEKLSLLGLIGEVKPIFGVKGGMWIGYSLTEKGYQATQDESLLDEIISEIVPPVNEVSESVRNLAEHCRASNLDENYRADLVGTLNEIAICFDHNCYIAVISLCGKVLEVCLTQVLWKNHVNPSDYQMIGRLMGAVNEHVPDFNTYDAFNNIGRIISRSRNAAIHFNQKIPVPSRDQAIMVIFATRDLVNRYIEFCYPD